MCRLSQSAGSRPISPRSARRRTPVADTVKAYAYDLKTYWQFIASRYLDWRTARLEDIGEFAAWL